MAANFLEFNENRSCIEIFFTVQVFLSYACLMKTEVVLKYEEIRKATESEGFNENRSCIEMDYKFKETNKTVEV